MEIAMGIAILVASPFIVFWALTKTMSKDKKQDHNDHL